MAHDDPQNNPQNDLQDNRKSSTLTAEEEAELVKSWQIPDVEDDIKQSSSKTNAMGRSVDWYYNQRLKEQQQVEEIAEIKPLTAEDIEGIRKAAYDEGLLQGHEDGFAQGREEGNALGHAEGLEKGQAEGFEGGLSQGQEEVQRQRVFGSRVRRRAGAYRRRLFTPGAACA